MRPLTSALWMIPFAAMITGRSTHERAKTPATKVDLSAIDGVVVPQGVRLGTSVAISEDEKTVVVGAASSVAGVPGMAYVFTRRCPDSECAFRLEQTLLAPAIAGAWTDFGSSVAVSGDSVIVGAPAQKSAHVYDRTYSHVDGQLKAVWSVEDTPLQAFPEPEAIQSVAMSTQFVPSQSDPYVETVALGMNGAAFVYYRACSQSFFPDEPPRLDCRKGWIAKGDIGAGWFGEGDRAGQSIAVDGDTIAVGAPGAEQDRGRVYVFGRSWCGDECSQWNLTAELDGRAPGAELGSSVAISGDTLVAGALGQEGKGAAFVYGSNEGGWIVRPQRELLASDGVMKDQFGSSVAASGHTAVVGDPLHQVPGNGPLARGAAYVFITD
jgi:FG-GAP repeat